MLLHPLKHDLDNIALQEVGYCYHNGEKKTINHGRQTDHYLYITKTLILYICMYVCSRNTAKTAPYSTFSCGVQYQVSFKSDNEKNILKNQFPIQSSPLREYSINANNLSSIVRWSYLFFFLK